MVGWLQDSIRAVDLLTSRPEVDSHRIGAMGCSGGGIDHSSIPLTQQRLSAVLNRLWCAGTQTAFVSSVDDRIGPAVIACYSSTFERQWDYRGVSTQYRALPFFFFHQSWKQP